MLQQEHGEQLFGLSVGRYAAGNGFARANSSAAALPGKQRPEPEQLFGVSCKSSSAAREKAAGDSSSPGWDHCPGGLTRTIVILNPEDSGAAARDGAISRKSLVVLPGTGPPQPE